LLTVFGDPEFGNPICRLTRLLIWSTTGLAER